MQPLPATAQERDIRINQDDQETTIDCKGNAVTIGGDDNNLTLRGECSRVVVAGDDNTINAATVGDLVVSGDDNTIRLQTVNKITTSGDDNTVTWTSGAGGKTPEVSNTGEDNTTRQAGS